MWHESGPHVVCMTPTRLGRLPGSWSIATRSTESEKANSFQDGPHVALRFRWTYPGHLSFLQGAGPGGDTVLLQTPPWTLPLARTVF